MQINRFTNPLPSLALALAALLIALPTTGRSEAMNYQGRLTDNSGVALTQGSATIVFNIWNHPTSTLAADKKWGPFTVSADLIDGRFNVVLGPLDSGNRDLAAALVGVNPAYIHMTVTPFGGATNTALPRQQIYAAPKALSAEIAVTVPDAAIGTTQLADQAVTGDKIMDNTIPVSKLTGAGANFWDGNGTSIWRTTGNVGIGVAFPTARLFVEGAPAENALRVRVGGMTKLVVDGNGGVSVGTGNTPPANGLLVAGHTVASGNMDISGNITEKGQQVTSGAEDLRIIRGIVNLDGSKRSGVGFSSNVSASIYTVTYDTAFASGDIPVVTANVLSTNGGDLPGIIDSSTNTGFVIRFGAQNITRTRSVPFNFIVVGLPQP